MTAADTAFLDGLRAERTLDAYDNALDAEDWTAVRVCFDDNVTYDLSRLSGADSELIAADELVARWRAHRRAGVRYHHMRSNHQTTVDGDVATVVSKRYSILAVSHESGDGLLEAWTTYQHRLARSAGGWVITEIHGTLAHRRGDRSLAR
jgi:hypothetical protein